MDQFAEFVVKAKEDNESKQAEAIKAMKAKMTQFKKG